MATTVTTSSSYLYLTEDAEFEVVMEVKAGATGTLGAASGLTSLSFRIAATKGGAAIGSLTFTASERGTTGIYYAVADTATLVAQLPEATYPDGTQVWLGLYKTGDVEGRWWSKRIRRHRIGDG
jgi:hypothetical protein